MRKMMGRFLNGEPNLSVCGEAGSPQEALSALASLQPDLVLVDVSLPTMSGIALVRELLKRQPDLKCLMVSAHTPEDYVSEALGAGARGFVTKEEPLEILKAITLVLAGERYLPPDARPSGERATK